MPMIAWPSSEDLKASSDQIDLQIQAATKTLTSVEISTKEVIKAVKIQSENVSKSLSSMETVLTELKKSDEKREKDNADLKAEIDLIKDMIPKVYP